MTSGRIPNDRHGRADSGSSHPQIPCYACKHEHRVTFAHFIPPFNSRCGRLETHEKLVMNAITLTTALKWKPAQSVVTGNGYL
jgi:hypothetical protein